MLSEENAVSSEKIYMGLLILLFLTSTDTIIFGTNMNRAFVYVPRIMALLGIVSIPIMHSNFKVYKKSFFALIVLLLIEATSFYINHTRIQTAISRILPVILACVIVENYSPRAFFNVLDSLLLFITKISIALYVLCIIAPGIVRSLPSFVNENGLRVFTIGFASVLEHVMRPGFTCRMSGIFWEPGAFAIYLCFGLLYHLFISEFQDTKKILIYVLGILITFSTTGYVCCILLIVIYSLSKNEISNKMKGLCIFVIIIAVLFYFVFENSWIYTMVFGKLFDGSGTTSTRISSIVDGMKIAKMYPVFGVGGQALEYMKEITYVEGVGRNTMLTNTIVHQFANYGFIFGSVFLIGTFKFCLFAGKRRSSGILLFLFVSMLYCGECFYSFLPFTIMFYGISNWRYK